MDGPLPGGSSSATRNPRPTKTVEILLDTTGDALAKTTTTQYDADLNATVTNQYDYVTISLSAAQNAAIGSIPQGSLIRTEEMTYLVNDLNISSTIRQLYRDRHLLSLPTNSKVKNSNDTVVAESQTLYDEAAYAPLTVSGTVPGWTNPNTTYRGQITTVRSWLNPGNTWLETHVQSDVLGNLRKAWDANGNVSEIQYNDSFSDTSKNALNTYAFATKAITPVPDPSGAKGSSVALESTTIYEYWTGRTISTTDANLKTTTFEYEGVLGSGYNSLNRPTRVVRPDGGETLFEYGDTPLNFFERIRTKQNASTWVETYSYLDGLSRAYRTATNEGSNSWSVKDTQYDNHGRAYRASNSYRFNGTNPKLATPPANEWTTTTFDAINRVLTVTTPDNAVITSSYDGNKVTAIDQAGKQRRTEADALGRTINVWEAPNAENFLTTQMYDALSNLTQVNQGGQIRTFAYDSLKRLTQATDPESGTKNYTYDSNGNLLMMTDARGITSSYTYDKLNRNTSVGYSSYPNGTSFTENYYDLSTNGKGRLRYNIAYNTLPNGNLVYSYNNVNNYDAMGRVTSYSQNFLINQGGYTWKPFTTSRTYDLAGNVTAQTYPSGRVTNYSYDTAGRLTNFNGTLGDGASRTYADQLAYNAAGQLTKERFGTSTSLYHNLHYNIRQQLYDSRLGTNSGDEFTWNRGALQFFYSTNQVWGGSGTDNNGNLFRADHWRPLNDSTSTWYTAYTYYGYDNLNRILSTSEYYNSSANGATQLAYTQYFDIDRWGNRQINAANTTDTLNEKQFQIMTANNRLKAPTDTGAGTDQMRYDAAGNLEWDEYTDPTTQGKWRGYDAAGRIGVLKTSAGATSEWARYVYDASGKRVRSYVNGLEKWFVYGIGGELIAEYMPANAQTNPSKEYGYRGGEILVATETAPSFTIRWMLYDLLGSARIITDLSGSLATIERHDYLPYGEELAPTVGQRNQGWQGYGVNTQRKKFTGYERDDESGLDFAQARYYASVQGRFTSPDPLLSSGMVEDPQSWNRYIYVGNRPTIATDPDGLKWFYNSKLGVFGWCNCTSLTDADRAKGWEDIGNSAVVYESKYGSLIYLDPNQRLYRNLTAEAADLARVNKNEKAREDAQKFVNAIILDFLAISLETGVTLGTGGTSLTFKAVAKEVLADEVKGFVANKMLEAVCFTAGTPVKTLNGDKPIEEIKPGDLVLSYNVESGELEYKQVVHTYIRESEYLYDLFIQGEGNALRVTANHPFFARPGCPRIETEGLWIRVDELHSGLDVLRPDGAWVRVIKLQRVRGKFTVYNFEVADNHDYFVGKQGILVHNANYGTPVQAGDSGAYGDLTGTKGDGLTPHHMPQAARGLTSYEEGGALVMPHSEHVQTRTYGGRGSATLAAEQGLDFRTTLARDIKDVRKIAGSKYNKGLLGLTDYYRKNFPSLINKPK
jgi:RHS repeat-associated protein